MNFLFSSSIESFLVVAGDAGVDGVGGDLLEGGGSR